MKSKRYLGLATAVADIYASHKAEIAALPRESARGGTNARTIPGWSLSPATAVSRLVRKNDWPHLNYWAGSRPTPSTAVPTCILDELTVAYNRLYKEVLNL